MKIHLTRIEAEETTHKLRILEDETALHQDYGLTADEARDLARSVPRDGGLFIVDGARKVSAVEGEMANHVEVLRDIAYFARGAGEINQARSIVRLATNLKKKFDAADLSNA